MRHKFILKICLFSALAVIFLFFFLSPIRAEETKSWEITPKLEQPIPGVELTPVTFTEEGTAEIPWIGQYIAGLYKWGIGAVGVIAVVMIIIGGFQWMLAGGNETWISAAKKRMSDAVIGLILILFIHTIMSLINPDLVVFKPLAIGVFKGKELEIEEDNTPWGKVEGITVWRDGECGRFIFDAGNKVNFSAYIRGDLGGTAKSTCVGPCHCAYFVSRYLARSSCQEECTNASADGLYSALLGRAVCGGWRDVSGEVEGKDNKLEANDLIFWYKKGSPSDLNHVAIYLGGGQIAQSGTDKKCLEQCKIPSSTCGKDNLEGPNECSQCSKLPPEAPLTGKNNYTKGGGSSCKTNQCWCIVNFSFKNDKYGFKVLRKK